MREMLMISGSGIMLTNNEIKDIIKIIRSLENRSILMKETTEKNNSQDRALFNHFLGPLMKIGLPLMKNIPTKLAESILLPLGLTTGVSVTDTVIQKKIWSKDD